MFYNSSTDKFINYFTRLLESESQIVFPNDVQLGGFSTAFGASVEPDRVVLSMNAEGPEKQNFKKNF